MRKGFIVSSIVLLLAGQPLPVVAVGQQEPPQNVLIVELQTGSLSTGTEEFVELYNPGEEAVDVTGWQLQYRPASALPSDEWKASSTKATLQCLEPTTTDCKLEIAAGQRLLLATYASEGVVHYPMKSGLADSGGQVRLVDNLAVVQDFIGYGSAVDSEGQPAPKPEAGKSLQRNVGEDGRFIDGDVNFEDFALACDDPTPGAVEEPVAPKVNCQEPPIEDPTEPDPNDPTDPDPNAPTIPEPGRGSEPVVYAGLNISEVFPDPASPQTDAEDEFVEIYNPSDQPVQLEDYALQTGSNFQTKVVIGAGVIAPHSYVVINSADSSLTLSNSGTGVRLLDPSGVVRDEAPNYGKAVPGQSWMLDSNGWHWTTTPTPTLANQLTLPPPPAPKATKSSATGTSKKATPKAAVAKVASASTAKPAETAKEPEPTQSSVPVHYWVVAAIGALVVGYGIYEYRHEITKGFVKLRSLVSRSG